MSKYRREEPATLAKHKHCPVCGTPIDMSKDYCTDKCRIEAKRVSKSKTRNFILITVGVFSLYILFLLVQAFG